MPCCIPISISAMCRVVFCFRVHHHMQPCMTFQHVLGKVLLFAFQTTWTFAICSLFGLSKQHQDAFLFSFKQTMTLQLRRKLVTGESLFLMTLRSNCCLTYRINSHYVSFNVSKLFGNLTQTTPKHSQSMKTASLFCITNIIQRILFCTNFLFQLTFKNILHYKNTHRAILEILNLVLLCQGSVSGITFL